MPNRNMPPLNALRAFEAAGRHLNFRLAAEELSVTQGAVSQQVRALEEHLKRPLFIRHARGLTLTPEGREYLATISKAMKLISQATENLSLSRAGLTISATPSLASKWLMPRIGQLAAQWPDMDVRLLASEGLSNFQQDGVDVAIRQGHAPFGPGLLAEELFAARLYMVCSPSILADGQIEELESFISSQTLLHDSHGHWPKFMEQHFSRLLGQHGQRSLNFSQTSLAIDAAIAGQGIALTSDPFANDAIANGLLVRLSDKIMASGPAIYVVSPRHPRRPDLVDRMRQWLLQQAKQEHAI